MLDLKRLYWNCRPFRSGPREAPHYQTLGLELPTFDFRALLQSDPERLAQVVLLSRDTDWGSPRQCAWGASRTHPTTTTTTQEVSPGVSLLLLDGDGDRIDITQGPARAGITQVVRGDGQG